MKDQQHPVEQFVSALRRAQPGVVTEVDEPSRPDGHWVVDVAQDGHEVVVEWRAKHGFGVTSTAAEAGFGEGPEELLEEPHAAAERVAELLRKKERTRPPEAVLLRDLRAMVHLTQEELAERLGVRQASVSKMERRQDMTLGTLRRVVEAMGGELVVTAKFPKETIRIGQFEEAPADTKKRASTRAACDHVAPRNLGAERASMAGLGGLGTTVARSLERACALAWGAASELERRTWDVLVANGHTLCERRGHEVTLSGPRILDLASSLGQTLSDMCLLLVAHEVGHAVTEARASRGAALEPDPTQEELQADRFAGWLAALSGEQTSPAPGAALFYELGCREPSCDYPGPQARLAAFVDGWDRGRSRRPFDDSYSEAPSLDGLVLRLDEPALPACRRFYEALGLVTVEERHGAGPLHHSARLSNTLVELYPDDGRSPVRLTLRVPCVEEALASLGAAGLSSTVRRAGTARLLLRDPAGNDVELLERAGHTCEASGRAVSEPPRVLLAEASGAPCRR